MKSRIRELRKKMALTQVDFGNRIGVKGNTITNYETGLRTPTDAVILAICREFHVNEEWLRYGTGEMFTPQRKSEEIAQFLADVMMEDENEFKFRLTSALAKMDDKGWNEIEKLIERINEKNNK